MLKDLLKFVDLKEGVDKKEVEDYLKGLTVTPEGVKEYLDTDDGKKLIQPVLDKYHAKSLESWKANNLDKITEEAVEKAIAEKYPEETDEQKRLKKLEQELESERRESKREKLRNKAISEATAKGLPVDLVDHFLGEDEDSTVQNLDKFSEIMQKAIEDNVNSKFKDGGTDPHKRNKESKLFSKDQVSKMSENEINENWEVVEKSMATW